MSDLDVPTKTVLYVEDDQALQGLIEFWLTDAGYRVLLAGDGVEGLSLVRSERPDLVITDAMMPNMTGDELVEVLKADPELSSIPVIMATAAASPLRTTRMLELGCLDVLGKPLDEDSFVAAARRALGD